MEGGVVTAEGAGHKLLWHQRGTIGSVRDPKVPSSTQTYILSATAPLSRSLLITCVYSRPGQPNTILTFGNLASDWLKDLVNSVSHHSSHTPRPSPTSSPTPIGLLPHLSLHIGLNCYLDALCRWLWTGPELCRWKASS